MDREFLVLEGGDMVEYETAGALYVLCLIRMPIGLDAT